MSKNAKTREGENSSSNVTQEDENPKTIGKERPIGKKLFQTRDDTEGHKRRLLSAGNLFNNSKPGVSNNKPAFNNTRRQRDNYKSKATKLSINSVLGGYNTEIRSKRGSKKAASLPIEQAARTSVTRITPITRLNQSPKKHKRRQRKNILQHKQQHNVAQQYTITNGNQSGS